VRARARVEAETAIARRLLLDTRARLHQIVLGFFFLRRNTQNYTKNCLFSPIEKDRNISVCRSNTGRISLPSTPSLLRPAVRYTLVYVSPPSSPPTPFPLSPAPLASGGISTAGVFRFPRNVGRVVAKGGKSRLISPSRFLLLSFISRTTTPFYFRIMSSRLDLQLKCAKSVFFFLSTKKKRYI